MTVTTRSQMHGHSRLGTTRCALGNMTNAHDGISQNSHSPLRPVRKATPKKKQKLRYNVTPKKTKDNELEELQPLKPTTLFQSNASAGISMASSSTATNNTRKTYNNVHWRSQSGLLKLTDKYLVFRTLHSKRLQWDSILHHEIRTHHHVKDGDCDDTTAITNSHENPVLHRNKYLLKLTMRKAGAPAIILRFASARDLDDADQEITRQLRLRSLQVFDQAYGKYLQEPRPSYYPIVRLCGSIPGSLVLDAEQFVFEPLTSSRSTNQRAPGLPTMTIPWTRLLSFEMKTTGNLQTSMSLSCQNSKQPIIFQFSSLRELERLHQDIINCLEWTEHNSNNNNSANHKALLLSPEMTVGSYNTPVLQNSKTKKKVTFSSPLVIPRTVSTSSPVSRMRSLSPKGPPSKSTTAPISFANRISKLSRSLVGLIIMGLQVWVMVEMVDTIGIAMTRLQPPIIVEEKVVADPLMVVTDTNDLVFQAVTQGVASWMKKDKRHKHRG